jgi:hypothetical protein
MSLQGTQDVQETLSAHAAPTNQVADRVLRQIGDFSTARADTIERSAVDTKIVKRRARDDLRQMAFLDDGR